MTAHKHAEMIKAKADNMELVVFVRPNHSDGWYKMQDDIDIPEFFSTDEYFLCHPKHEKECLHWLNGGKVEIINDNGFRALLLSEDRHAGWSPYFSFMSEQKTIRIKPRKEKRWIVTNGERVRFINSDEIYPLSWQLIEIEVEV